MVSICGGPLIDLFIFLIHFSYCNSYRVHHLFRGAESSFYNPLLHGLPVHPGRGNDGLLWTRSFSLSQPGRKITVGEEISFVDLEDFQKTSRSQNVTTIIKAEKKRSMRTAPPIPIATQFLMPNASTEMRFTPLVSAPTLRSDLLLPVKKLTQAHPNTIPYFQPPTQLTGTAQVSSSVPSEGSSEVSAGVPRGMPVGTPLQAPAEVLPGLPSTVPNRKSPAMSYELPARVVSEVPPDVSSEGFSEGRVEVPSGMMASGETPAMGSELSVRRPAKMPADMPPRESRGMAPDLSTEISLEEYVQVPPGASTKKSPEASVKTFPSMLPTCLAYVSQPSCETALLPQEPEAVRAGHQALQSIIHSLNAIIAKTSHSRREAHRLETAFSDVAPTQSGVASNNSPTSTPLDSLGLPNRLPELSFAAFMSASEWKKAVLYGFDILQSVAYETFNVNELMLLCTCESDTTEGRGLIQSVILSGFDQVLDHRFFNHLWNGAGQRQAIAVDNVVAHNNITSDQADQFVSVLGPVDKRCNNMLHLAVLSENPLMVTKLLRRLHDGRGFGRSKEEPGVNSLFTSQNLDGLTPLQLVSSKVTTSVQPGIRAVLKKWFLILRAFRRYQKLL